MARTLKILDDVISGASTVEVPFCSPSIEPVSVSELNKFGRRTETVAAEGSAGSNRLACRRSPPGRRSIPV